MHLFPFTSFHEKHAVDYNIEHAPTSYTIKVKSK